MAQIKHKKAWILTQNQDCMPIGGRTNRRRRTGIFPISRTPIFKLKRRLLAEM